MKRSTQKYKSVKIRQTTKTKLKSIKAEISVKENKLYNFIDTIDYLVDFYNKNK